MSCGLLVIGGSTLVSQVTLSDDYNSITTVRFPPRKHEVHLSLSGCLNRSDAAQREKYLKSAPILEGETQELSHGVNGNIAVSQVKLLYEEDGSRPHDSRTEPILLPSQKAVREHTKFNGREANSGVQSLREDTRAHNRGRIPATP